MSLRKHHRMHLHLHGCQIWQKKCSPPACLSKDNRACQRVGKTCESRSYRASTAYCPSCLRCVHVVLWPGVAETLFAGVAITNGHDFAQVCGWLQVRSAQMSGIVTRKLPADGPDERLPTNHGIPRNFPRKFIPKQTLPRKLII